MNTPNHKTKKKKKKEEKENAPNFEDSHNFVLNSGDIKRPTKSFQVH